MNTTTQGARGEEQAARFLTGRGHTLLERNFRAAGGEIDLITRQGRTLVFVEVKLRTCDTFGGPVAAVTPAKQKRIAVAAAQYLKTHPQVRFDQIRFDVVCILPQSINHIENAFVPKRTTL